MLTNLSAKYAYVRVSVAFGDVEVCGGLELRNTERCDVLYEELEREIRGMLPEWLMYPVNADDVFVARAYETVVRARWPGRSYFVEVGRADDRYVQIFEPKHLVDPE